MSEPTDNTTDAERDRWRLVDRLLEQALELPDGERDRYLREQCDGDEALLRRVRRLLTAASSPDTQLHGPNEALVLAALDDEYGPRPGEIEPGSRVGRYRVLGELGRGGMATVYHAERADGAFERRVALKLLRRGLDTDEIVARFLGERQILSGLDHPNIARLIDGGASEDGRPYLVMERVPGEPITEWADHRTLSVGDRLELFCQAAEAVQYAHQRLIIHRDLKPSNILVDEDGTVKLLDFGIAKLLDPTGRPAVDSLTRTGVRPLTPAYASPEQLRGEQVTTASDVHQLGSVLYELLSGARAFEGTGPELEAAILSGRVQKPSEAAKDARRSTLRGDLDAIVLTALRVEPERRYASVTDFVADVRRYLALEPVRARPDTVAYRAGRFVRRRPEVVGAAAVFVLLLGGYVGTLVRHADRLEAERDRAQLEAAKAQEVSQFLIDLFAANDPNANEGESLTAFDLLQRGEARAAALESQPEVQADMLRVVGEMYVLLGRYAEAEPVLLQSVEGLERMDPVPEVDLAGALEQLGDLYQRTGRYAEGDSLVVRAIGLARAGGNAVVEGYAHNTLGHSLLAQGDYRGAEAAFREGLATRREAFGASTATARSLHGLAIAYEEQERLESAESTYVASLEMMERVDPEHTSLGLTLASLGRMYIAQGRLEEADSVLRRSLELSRARLGDDHVSQGLTLNELGTLAARRGVLDEAEQYFRESLVIQERALGPDHPEVATAINNISYTLFQRGEYEGALPLRKRAVEVARSALGDHPNTSWFALNLGIVHERLGQSPDAIEAYRESLAISRNVFPDGDFQTTTPMVALGDLLARTGQAQEGARLLREALEDRMESEAVPASIADVESMLGAALARLGRDDEAREFLERGLSGLEDAVGADADLTASARARLEAFERR